MVLLSLLAALLTSVAPVFSRAPLAGADYAELPLGAIKPQGWLLEQLNRQATGLSANLDEVYPEVMGPSNAWLGGDGDSWERGPYWIDGLLPLGYILDDKALKDKAMVWVEAILSSQREDGYFGPAEDRPFVYGLQRGASHDWWPKMVALKIIQQYYMASGDRRAIDFLLSYFRYQARELPSAPLDHWTDWGEKRGADNLEIVYWLYDLTGEEYLLDLGELIHSQCTDWSALFREGEIFHRQGSVHTVNLAQGFKSPVVWWRFSHSDEDLNAPRMAMEEIRSGVGLPNGLWAGDEQLHYGNPTRGSELCCAVEMMYSAEEMLRLGGDPFWGDVLERIAYNALPAQITDDFTFKQYYQQSNQISCTRAWRPFSTPHDDTDVLFGTLNGYPCCLSNMHQGWPKFTRNLWYSTPDGLAAMVYAPCAVTATLPGGVRVRITESTDYPFKGKVTLGVDFPDKKVRQASFSLRLRVPSWSSGVVLTVNGEAVETDPSLSVITLERNWKKGDTLEMEFTQELCTEEWWDSSLVFTRGPLVYALRMEENWRWTPFRGRDRIYGPGAWEVTSPTPWNYCIMRDCLRLEDCLITESDSVAPYPWNLESAPVTITVPARRLPHWKEYSGSAGEIAYWCEDGNDTGEDTLIELIPYGCTTLRITQFPTRLVPWDLKWRESL